MDEERAAHTSLPPRHCCLGGRALGLLDVKTTNSLTAFCFAENILFLLYDTHALCSPPILHKEYFFILKIALTACSSLLTSMSFLCHKVSLPALPSHPIFQGLKDSPGLLLDL